MSSTATRALASGPPAAPTPVTRTSTEVVGSRPPLGSTISRRASSERTARWMSGRTAGWTGNRTGSLLATARHVGVAARALVHARGTATFVDADAPPSTGDLLAPVHRCRATDRSTRRWLGRRPAQGWWLPRFSAALRPGRSMGRFRLGRHENEPERPAPVSLLDGPRASLGPDGADRSPWHPVTQTWDRGGATGSSVRPIPVVRLRGVESASEVVVVGST